MQSSERQKPKRRWTLHRALKAIALAWLALLVIFAPGRVCEPLFSERCAMQAWNYVGDVVWLKGLYGWQTMATGIIALVAAAIGAWFVHIQVQLEHDRRRRVAASVRALMPHTLSSLIDYLEDCFAELDAARTGAKFDRPASPTEVIAQLQRMVEVSDDLVAVPFSALLGQIQILNSRLRHLAKQSRLSRSNVDTYTLNIMEIHAAASKLFPFARAETDELPTQKDIAEQYVSSLKILSISEIDYPSVFKTAEERASRIVGTKPKDTP